MTTNKLIEHQEELHKQLEAYYKKQLSHKFSNYPLNISDTALVDYLERVQLITPSYAKYIILETIETYCKLKNVLPSSLTTITVNDVVFSFRNLELKEISTFNLPIISSFATVKKKDILVTPHAIIRYLQRVELIPIVECRFKLANSVLNFLAKHKTQLIHLKGLDSWEVKFDKVCVVLKKNVIVTVYYE